jgi:hypothetical protein
MRETFAHHHYKSIILKPKLFKKIKKYIKTAVIFESYGYIFINISCFEQQKRFGQRVKFIYNYHEVPLDQACLVCVNRIQKITGGCSYEFSPIEKDDYSTSLKYIVDILIDMNIKEDKNLFPTYYLKRDGFHEEFEDITTFEAIIVLLGAFLFIIFYFIAQVVLYPVRLFRKLTLHFRA